MKNLKIIEIRNDSKKISNKPKVEWQYVHPYMVIPDKIFIFES